MRRTVSVLFKLMLGAILSLLIFTGCKTETPESLSLTSISISSFPEKLVYKQGEILDLTGLEVTAKYSDGSEKIVTGWSSSPKNGSILSTEGKVTVQIKYGNSTASFDIEVKAVPKVISNSFFWGCWVRMDNGKQYEVLEDKVIFEGGEYDVSSTTDSTLSVNTLGTFVKESDSVIINNNIPYFRNGGANLEYSLKLVGFTNSDRAAGTSAGGIKGKAKSDKYTSFEDESESNEEGIITFKAPTKGDTQTVTIENGDEAIVIPGLEVLNDGDYMGTVALVGKDDYNLKITGTISEDQKDDGYLYGNNAKTYDLTITITNISENVCRSSACEILPDDPGLNLTTSTGYSSFTISTLKAGATKVENCKISYGDLTEAYIDTGITVRITNSKTEQVWIDYIPLRFYRGLIPMTIAAKSPEQNDNAALNGFIIYPDGNNQFFSVPNNESRTLFVPTFGNSLKYTMIFSGATVTSELADSTEMYYSVSPASSTKREVVTYSNDINELIGYMNFGGNNHSEETAFNVESSFQAYLSDGEIDYYKITADGDEYYAPESKKICYVYYESDHGTAPQTKEFEKGTILTSSDLPFLTAEGWNFQGWYTNSSYTQKVEAGFTVNSSITLYAKWEESKGADDSFVFVEGGTFDMGSTSGYSDEKPVHTVTVSSFYMSPYEVTQKEYTEIMGSNPSYYSSNPASGETQNLRPVEMVSWYDALVYCNKRSIAEGLTPCYTISGSTDPSDWGSVPTWNNSTWNNATCNFKANGYRLPTEAEWEYAARGGKNKNTYTYSGSNTAGNVAWYFYNSGRKTHQVGTKNANSLGIHDMSGNVYEWCWDWYGIYSSSSSIDPTGAASGSYRVLRGGSWGYYDYNCTVSYRRSSNPYDRGNDYYGFRLVRSATTSSTEEKYTITYSTEYGTAPQTKEVEKGAALTSSELPTLTAEGWNFQGWYTNSSYTQKVEVGFTVNSSITLYAKWEESKCVDDSFVFVEGGTFDMGSTSGYSDEKPVHTVTVSSFYMSPYEVTQKEYTEIMGSNPSSFSSNPASGETQNLRPVEKVSWYDALVYCNKRSIAEGLTPCYTISGSTDPSDWGSVPTSNDSTWDNATCNFKANGYRLPTEAEWEYAARGGKNKDSYTYSGSNTVDDVAWYSGNSGSKTHQVGTKNANSLGIHDMSGNVWEWCWDWRGSYRVLRGGSWYYNDYTCYVSDTVVNDPYYRSGNGGFRLVRSATTVAEEKCTISYSTEYGTAPQTKEFEKGTILTSSDLPSLTAEGWNFQGWYTNSSYTQKVEAGFTVNSSITLYAKWEESKCVDDNFVFVEGGTFDMGKGNANLTEHTVTVSSFYMSPYEVTQEEYSKIMGSNPSSFSSQPTSGEAQKLRPVESVNWYAALVYCNKLSIAEGLTPCYAIGGSTNPSVWGTVPSSRNTTWNSATCNFKANGYRLPTEAEWEYAARGGKNNDSYKFSGADTPKDVAWSYDNSSSITHQVGTKDANSLGIYDMSGNVSEWCWDWYGSYTSSSQTDPKGSTSGTYRVLRGGSCDYLSSCTVYDRSYQAPWGINTFYGFRIVRSLSD